MNMVEAKDRLNNWLPLIKMAVLSDVLFVQKRMTSTNLGYPLMNT